MPGVINDSRADVLPTPNSYAVQQPQPILIETPKVTEAVRNGIKAGQLVNNQAANNIAEARQVVADMKTRDLKALASLSPTLAGYFKQQEEDEFAQGYLRHFQGESIAEIGKDDPFRKIFGDGAAVRGARMREQEAVGLGLTTWIQENHGDLIRMSLDEQRIAVGEYVKTLGTNDPQSDALIAQGVMKALPSVMDNLARGHVEEQQKQAAVSQSEVIKQTGDMLRFADSEKAKGRLSEAGYAQIQNQFLEAIRPLPGQSPEAYRAAMVGNYQMLLKDGQFAQANWLEEQVLSQVLEPEERLKLYSMGKQAQAIWLMDNPLSQSYSEYSETLPSHIQAGRFRNTKELLQSIDDMNQKYQQETGTPYPLINNKERAQYVDYFEKNRLREQEKAQAAYAKQLEKAYEEETRRALYYQGYSQGDPVLMSASGLDSKQKYAVDQQVMADFFTSPNIGTAETIGKLAINGGVNPLVKQTLNATISKLRNGSMPSQAEMANLQVAVKKFNNITNSEAAFESYFGEYADIAKDAINYDLVNDPRAQEDFRTTVQTKKMIVSAPQEIRDLAKENIKELSPGFWSRTLGNGVEIGAGTEQRLKQLAEQEMVAVISANPNLPASVAQERSLSRVMSKASMIGNRLIEGDRGRNVFNVLNKNLTVPINDPQDTRFNVMFNDFIADRLGTKDFEIGSINVINNSGEFANATVIDKDGLPRVVPISMSGVASLYNSKLRDKQKESISKEAVVREQSDRRAKSMAETMSKPFTEQSTYSFAEAYRKSKE